MFRLFFFLPLILTAFTSSCKHQHIHTSNVKVIEGVIAREGQLLGIVKFGRCSGAFLNNSVMLTAAHCVVTKEGVKPKIRLNGHTSLHTETANRNFPEIYRQAITDKTYANKYAFVSADAALVKFHPGTADALKIPNSSLKRIAPLSHIVSSDTLVYIVGYGQSKTNDSSTFGTLRWGINKIDSIDRDVFFVSTTVANKPRSDAMSSYGDSGGPVLDKESELVIGINSWGSHASTGVQWKTHIQNNQVRELFRYAIEELGFERFSY